MDQNIIDKETSISSLATLLSNLTLRSIFYIWIVAYILQHILEKLLFPIRKILYKLLDTDNRVFIVINTGSYYVISALFSFISLYITLKYFLQYLQLSNEKKVDYEIPWGRARIIAIWAIPFINLIPLFFVYLVLALSTGRAVLGLESLFIGATLPFIGLTIAFLQYKKAKSFSLFSINTIPVFLCLFEIFIVFKAYEMH